MAANSYWEKVYQGPWKGIVNHLPENMISSQESPFLNNVILKNGEIRSNPRQSLGIKGPVNDNSNIALINSFLDANNVVHTVIITQLGLWQLNPNWPKYPDKAWNLVAPFSVQPGSVTPSAYQTFLNTFYWTNGGPNLFSWDGITSVGSVTTVKRSTFYIQGAEVTASVGGVVYRFVANNFGKTATVAPVFNATLASQTVDGGVTFINNGKPIVQDGFKNVAVVDATNGYTAGAFFLGELGFRLIMLNTVESTGSYPQRVRWTPSGYPSIWDPNVNIGAGFSDEIDVPDGITGFLTIGRVGFIFRVNGITELTQTGNGLNPFDFNHLWASDRGIGNIYSYTIAGYGPIGIFISNDEIYQLSLGGFERIGATSRDLVLNDLARATSTPVATIYPYYQKNYVYTTYMLTIPFGDSSIVWRYSIEDRHWTRSIKPKGIYTGRANFVQIA